jgi:hypothetical protein
MNPTLSFIGLIFASLSFSSILHSAASKPLDIYVAIDGDDAVGKGTKAAPFATLTHAKAHIAAKKHRSGLPHGATVWLSEGLYTVTETIQFGPEDSGSEDAPIAYRALPGHEVSLLAGALMKPAMLGPISDPQQKSRLIDQQAADRILECKLSDLGISDPGVISRRGYSKASQLSKMAPSELFIDGQPMTLARWPNGNETVRMGQILDPGPLVLDPAKLKRFAYKIEGNEVLAERMREELGEAQMAELLARIPGATSKGRTIETHMPFVAMLGNDSPDLHKRGGTFVSTSDRPFRWAEVEDIWVGGIFAFSWEYSYNRLAAVDPQARTITLRYGEVSGLLKNWIPDFHHYENVFEELDRPGEYYIDRKRGRLYFYPPEGVDVQDSELLVSRMDQPLLSFKEASHITLSGLTLKGGRTSAVIIESSEHIQIDNSEIRSFAGDGITIHKSSHCHVDHCEISHVGKTAVRLGGGEWATLTPGNNEVSNSNIHRYAYRDKAYNPGIKFPWKSVGNRARGNKIHHAPHGGIELVGNDHLIEGNEFTELCLDFKDFGAIYVNLQHDPMDRGTLIRGNFFHNIRPEVKHGIHAVYLDVACWDIEVSHNVIANIGGHGIFIKGHYLNVHNNLSINVRGAACWSELLDRLNEPRWKKEFAKMPIESSPHARAYPNLKHFWRDIEAHGRASGPLNRFDDNVTVDPNGYQKTASGLDAILIDYRGSKAKKHMPQESNNLVLKDDSDFPNWHKGDFRYRGASPDLKKRLSFVDELFDEQGRFKPTLEAGRLE